MNTGWIKMHRQIMDKSWYSKPSYVSMWATLLLLATHRGMEVWFAGKPVKLKPGQLITGRKSLAKLTGIHESSVQRILTHFEKIEHQIEQRISNQNRLITVINWDRYQGLEHQIEQPVNNQRTSSEQPVNTNKNDKNVDNDKNVNIPRDPKKKTKTEKRFEIPPVENVIMYFQEKGITGRQGQLEGEKFFDFYTSKGWFVGKNKMKNWKSAVNNWIRGIKERGSFGKSAPARQPHPDQAKHEIKEY